MTIRSTGAMFLVILAVPICSGFAQVVEAKPVSRAVDSRANQDVKSASTAAQDKEEKEKKAKKGAKEKNEENKEEAK